MADEKPGVNAAGVSIPFATEDMPWETWSEGTRFGSRFRHISSAGGASHVGVVIEELAPGKTSSPPHYHMLEEEQALILAGELTLHLGEETFRMVAGDHVCFPAGQRLGHCFYNHGSETCRFLIIGEKNPNDVIVYTESGRVGVRLLDEGYRKSATMDYWEEMRMD